MRTATQINQWTTAIDGRSRSGDFLFQNAHLEFVVSEHLQQVFFLHLQTFKALLVLKWREWVMAKIVVP